MNLNSGNGRKHCRVTEKSCADGHGINKMTRVNLHL